MKKEWNDVREFHEKFGHPVAGVPKMVDKKRALSRGKWMNEEVAEFLVAEDIYEQADAMIDLIYFALGTLVEIMHRSRIHRHRKPESWRILSGAPSFLF